MTNPCRILFLGGALLCPSAGTAQSREEAQFLQHVRSAILHLENGELTAAKRDLETALAIDRQAPNALTLLGLVHESSGNLEDAIQYHQKALVVDPQFKPARNNLASSLYRLGNPDLALSEFQRVLASDPTDLTANFNAGRIFLGRHEYLQARDRLAAARAVSPGDAGILLGLAECYFNLGRTEDANEALSSLSDSSDQLPEVKLRHGVLLLSHGQTESALDQLQQAAKLAPQNPVILVSLAEAQLATSRTDAAANSVDAFIDALKSFGLSGSTQSTQTRPLIERAKSVIHGVRDAGMKSADLDFLYAETSYLLHDYGHAIQVLERVSEEADNDPNYLNLKGMSYAGLGDYRASSQALREALVRDPQRPDLLFNLGTVYQKAGQNAAALEIFERLADLSPGSAPVLFALAASRFNAGEFGLAVANLQEVVEIAPKLQEARVFLGRCFDSLGRTEEAASAYQEALRLNARCEECRFRLAQLQVETGDASGAAQNLRILINFVPEHAQAHYELGKILQATGEYVAAIEMLEEAIRLDPTHDGAYYQLGRLYAQLGEDDKARELLGTLQNNKEKRLRDYQDRVSSPNENIPER